MEEQPLRGFMGRAIQPQATYIHQPEVRVFHGLIQHAAGPLLVRNAVICHGLNSREDDICPFKRLEVFSKRLWEEVRERRCVTLSVLMVMLSWAA